MLPAVRIADRFKHAAGDFLERRVKAFSLIEELLAEQQQLTVVERFAQRRNGEAGGQTGFYQDLVPLQAPGKGQQYAFRVDLDACTGCKACVSACHSLNGLDENETWRSVGLLHGGEPGQPYQQTVTTACHHCVDPACLEGCPVLAYEKDEATGIVRHLDDQCIGCQYCLLKCPYDVPKYSSRRGIVRKCDMCYGRLVEGEPPACAQACPSRAISIQIVSRNEIVSDCAGPGKRLLPGAFRSDYTRPTTTYVSRKPFPDNCEPADAVTLRLAPAHWPLVWMLVLTQAAAGLFGAAWLAAMNAATFESISVLSFTGCLLLHLGLAASVFHLGRPLGAWRAFLGWRRSWMSREIIAFAVFSALAMGLTFGTLSYLNRNVLTVLSGATAGVGFLAVSCSALIYIDTRRPAWNPTAVFGRFMGTAFLLGASTSACCLAWMGVVGNGAVAESGRFAAIAATMIRVSSFAWETWQRQRDLRNPAAPAHRSARILSAQRAGLLRSQVALFIVATVSGLAAVLLSGFFGAVCATISLACTMAGQVAERYGFFVAAAEPGMPGSVAS
jgi:formate dehydrogenase iron-sulfur subunit